MKTKLPYYEEKIKNFLSFEQVFEKACSKEYKQKLQLTQDLVLLYQNSVEYNGINSNFTKHLVLILKKLSIQTE